MLKNLSFKALLHNLVITGVVFYHGVSYSVLVVFSLAEPWAANPLV